MPTFIMILEDDPSILQIITEYVKDAGYQPLSFTDGVTAKKALDGDIIPDLFVLDIMVPGISGLELLSQIRKHEVHKQTPVIMLTALGDEATQILSFNALADDYVTKPFSPKVLMKRIKALLRRTSQGHTVLVQGNISLDPESYQVWENKEEVLLTLREFEILKTLMEHTGKVFTRQELLNLAWGYDYFGDERIVDVHIKNIRKKFSKELIRTVKGVGYQMNQEESL